jgi:hypothetical protein
MPDVMGVVPLLTEHLKRLGENRSWGWVCTGSTAWSDVMGNVAVCIYPGHDVSARLEPIHYQNCALEPKSRKLST